MKLPFAKQHKRPYHRKLTPEDKKANSPLAGTLLVLAVAGFVGFFAFSSQAKQPTKESPMQTTKTEEKRSQPSKAPEPVESKEVPSRSSVVILGEIKEITPQTILITTIAAVEGIETEKDFSVSTTKETIITHQEKQEDERGQPMFISKKSTYSAIKKGDFVQIKTKDDILSQNTIVAESIDYSEFNPLLP